LPGGRAAAFTTVPALVQACTVHGAMPKIGPVVGGSDITIIGNNFGVVDDGPKAFIGTTPW
jgi:hypothetical protein